MGVDFDLTGLHDDHTIRAGVPPPLSELCVRVLAAHFAHRPTLRGIAPRYINRLTELLPTTLPLEVTGPLIDDEGYWKRCATNRWENCTISEHGSSWKRCYFEKNLTDFLETFDPLKTDTEELMRMLAISKDYVLIVLLTIKVDPVIIIFILTDHTLILHLSHLLLLFLHLTLLVNLHRSLTKIAQRFH